jgi:hypothetical protein
LELFVELDSTFITSGVIEAIELLSVWKKVEKCQDHNVVQIHQLWIQVQELVTLTNSVLLMSISPVLLIPIPLFFLYPTFLVVLFTPLFLLSATRFFPFHRYRF